MAEFAEERYFERIAGDMSQSGFILFCRVSVSTEDTPYYETVKGARVTKLFFFVPGSNFIVIMSYREIDTGATARVSWDIRVELEFSSRLAIETYFFRREIEMFLKHPIDLSGFRFGGWSRRSPLQYTWNIEQIVNLGDAKLAPSVLTAGISEAYSHIAPFMKEPPFAEIVAACWPPIFEFPDCERIFWQRFFYSLVLFNPLGKGSLRQIVTNLVTPPVVAEEE